MKNTARKIFSVFFLTAALGTLNLSAFIKDVGAQTPQANGPAAPAAAADRTQEGKSADAPTPTTGASVLKSQNISLPPMPVPRTPEKRSLDQTDKTDAGQEAKPAPYRGAVTSMQKPIVIETNTETLEQRMDRTITLDVREMNALDVLKFLALKGDFNMITGEQVKGRVTLYLKNVKIKDALDIIVISNNLAYYIEKDIVYVLSDGEYMALFGKHFNEKTSIEIVQLKYAKPSYLMATLESLRSALGKIIIDEDTGTVAMIDTPESLAKMRAALDRVETSLLEPIIYSLQYAKVTDVAEKLKARLDAHSVGSITIDDRSNKLIVRAFPERRKEVEALIRALDSPTKEVLIEMRVLQVVFKPQMDYGIDWQKDFRNSPNGDLQKLSFSNIMTSASSSTLYGQIAYGNFDVDDFQFNIKMLKQVSDARILSNPRLLVTNNEEAKIMVGDTVPYIVATVSGTGENAITSEDVRFVDTGVKINVTPTINDEGFITLRVQPEISTVTTYVKSTRSTVPQVNKTTVESTVMVKDGMTIVLGGLKKENKSQTRQGIPVLMDVPFLRHVFSGTTESVEATEIVIFITPHIIKGDQDYQRFKGDIKPDQPYHDKKLGLKDGAPLASSPSRGIGIKE